MPIELVLPSIQDADVQAILAQLKRASYTLEQHREEVLPISRSAQYEEIGAGRLRTTKRGASTLVTAIDAATHLALLRRESAAAEPPEPLAPQPHITAPKRPRKRSTAAEGHSNDAR